jgi:ribonuclease Z
LTKSSARIGFVVSLCLAVSGHAAVAEAADDIRVTLLGTGTPYPDVDRFGAAILVDAGGAKLLFDCGRGAVIRLRQAGVPVQEVTKLFLTHFHSDHTVGIPDLWLSGWFLGRETPLQLWGPDGTREMAAHLLDAFGSDVRIREAPPESLPDEGARIRPHEVEEGIVYHDGGVRVSAVLVDHGHVEPAFGYRVDHGDRSVVISGDTKFSEALVDFSAGTDCVIHVAWMAESRNRTPPSSRSLASAEDAGRVFARVRPKLGVIYHFADSEGLVEAVQSEYQGPLVIAEDLMVIDISEETTWHIPSTPTGPR